MTPRFLRFLAAGAVAAAANLLSRLVFNLAMPYVPSIVLAYMVGMITAFLLNRSFVFTTATNPVGRQVFWFVVVNLLAVTQTVLLSVFFARWVFPAMGMDFYPHTVAHAIGVVVPVFTSYIGHSLLSFRTHQADASD